MLRKRLGWAAVLALACPAAAGVALAQETSSEDHSNPGAASPGFERRFEARSWALPSSPTLPTVVTSIADDPLVDVRLDDLESIDARARQAERLLKRSLRNSLSD